ncbi:MAG: hypothetical protein AAF961_08990, partial [Planctomycetota bacterium]
ENDAAQGQLGRVMLEVGDVATAAKHLREAVRLNPSNVAASLSLAWLQATSPSEDLRDGGNAQKLAQRVFQSPRGQTAITIDILAAAYAEQGDYGRAESLLRRLLDQLGEDRAGIGETLKSRLAEYKAGRPYRDPDAKYP